MEGWLIGLIVGIVIIIFIGIVFAVNIRKCPPDKIMVIYGKLRKKDGKVQSSICMHGGRRFVLPILQSYQYLDLTPISINIDLKGAMARGNVRINIPTRVCVGISTEKYVMQNAAERLLGLRHSEIGDIAKDIVFGQMRNVVALMNIDDIFYERDLFLREVTLAIEMELKKFGLKLITMNISDIIDDAGYVESLARKTASDAINKARVYVAQRDHDAIAAAAQIDKDTAQIVMGVLKDMPQETLKKYGLMHIDEKE